jgi:hypothetical protein
MIYSQQRQLCGIDEQPPVAKIERQQLFGLSRQVRGLNSPHEEDYIPKRSRIGIGRASPGIVGWQLFAKTTG